MKSSFLKLLPYTFIRLTRNAEVKYTDVFGGYPQWGEITFIHLRFTKNECVMKIPCEKNKGCMKIRKFQVCIY